MMITTINKLGSSIPKIFDSWAETQAAYRFFANEKVNADAVLNSHFEATQARIKNEKVVLCLEDTTSLNYNYQDIEGLGRINHDGQTALFLHPMYAITPERQTLGLLNVTMWAREKNKPDKTNKNKSKLSKKVTDLQHHDEQLNEIENSDKIESYRWIKGYLKLAETAKKMPETNFVYLADRESDIFELFMAGYESNFTADIVVRASHNRSLANGKKLWDSVGSTPVLGKITFEMPARKGHKKRTVTQELRAERVKLQGENKQQVEMTCIISKEINAPEGIKPTEWRLLTNKLIKTTAEASTIIDWYRARWEIEMYFDVLKNCCQVERLQLSTATRIQNAVAMFMILAFRINMLKTVSRTNPTLKARLFFSKDEIFTIYALRKLRAPKNPTIHEVVRLLARLGGFLARKSDGEPGSKTIYSGFLEMQAGLNMLDNLRYLKNS